MKRRLIAAVAALTWATSSLAAEMTLAVTTSFHNSGLSEVLLPAIQADLGLNVQLLVVGTGQALRLGEAGDVDAILVHSKAAEEKFLAAGNGTHRREIMYNDFVFVGPGGDAAGIGTAGDAREALQKISAAEAVFVSRGDNSGTHNKELSLWASAALEVEDFGAWYTSVGAGMGAALNTASGLNAYILADRASWLNFGNKADLQLLFAGDPVLFNQYSYIPVNPAKHPHVKSALAAALEAWLVSDRARVLIDSYQIKGETLFVFNGAQK
ncbi:MAG: substrate-binding domain-containing protein [Rhodobacteraceae bacterium]|nr:substrate-binding domain-containing protein [Paracoccaceae bacterium]